MALTTDSTARVLGKRYRLLSPLGSGASAHVYLAEDLTLERHVAVKVLLPGLAQDEAFLKRFRAEARAAGSLNHPHVMKVFDWGEEADGPYLVLEYLGGGNLRELLDRGILLTPAEAASVGSQAASGLAYAHGRGIVHRDVKPANLLFDEEGRLRVGDFGVARALAASSWTEPVGAVIGTARYVSPEQAQGQAVDGRADVYALALLLYESVTGTLPFVADTSVGTLMARIGRPLPPHRALGLLNPVLHAAADPDEASRPSAAELVRSLEAVSSRLPPPGSPMHSAHPEAPRGAIPPARAPQGGAATLTNPTTQPIPPARPTQGGAATLTNPPTQPIPPPQPTSSARPSWWAHPTRPPQTNRTTPGVPAVRPAHASDQATGQPTGTAVLSWAVRPPGPVPLPEVAAPPFAPPQPVQAPRRRRWLRWTLAVLVVLALAAAGLAYAIKEKVFTPSHPVPHVVGMTLEQADLAARVDRFPVEVAGRQYSTSVPAGHVVVQRPAASQPLKEGDPVQVVLSKGLPPERVPSLSGLDCAGAQRVLGLENLYGSCPSSAAQYSSSVPTGQVISWSYQGVEHPTTAPWHSTIAIVVSDGPPPQNVPHLSADTYAQAAAQLSQLGLKATEVKESSSKTPSGEVISTDPPAGQQVPAGSTVTVYVSTGSPASSSLFNLFGLGQ